MFSKTERLGKIKILLQGFFSDFDNLGVNYQMTNNFQRICVVSMSRH